MFTPKISITVPKTADSVVITDVTGNYPADPTGYQQAAYLPQDNTEWDKQAFVTPLGGTQVQLTFNPTSDSQLAAASLAYGFSDGVYLITQYFSKQLTSPEYTIDATLKILTKTNADQWADPLGLFEGAYGLIVSNSAGFSIDDVCPILTLSNTEITLSSALTGATTDSDVWVVYRVQKYILVAHTAEGDLISDIGDMALSALRNGQGCDPGTSMALWNRFLLKMSAQINMSCGNYTKAHNALVLLSQSSDPNPSCSTCG